MRSAALAFGHPLTLEELAVVNTFTTIYRKALGKEPLLGSPAVRFLKYGKNNEGYWTHEHFAEQTADILDMYEKLCTQCDALFTPQCSHIPAPPCVCIP